MKSTKALLNHYIKRWNSKLEGSLGLRIEPHLIVILAAIALLLVQFVIFIALSNQTIYCQLPNMRFYHLDKNEARYERLPTIYVVTPTYARHVQKAELTRLSHTLLLVPNLHWIIVEDSQLTTKMVSKFARKLKDEFNFHKLTLLREPTPERFKLKPGEPNWKHPKGVWQRNRALEWIHENMLDLDKDGVVYFADDDNTYDLSLFNEMRNTRKVSVWPVGFVGGLLVERPILDSSDKVQSFNSMWQSQRPFPLDMAGFAISMHHLSSHPRARFSADQRIGYIESHFLQQFVDSWEELEPKANRCTEVLVWHTKTQNPSLHEERKLSRPSHSDIEW